MLLKQIVKISLEKTLKPLATLLYLIKTIMKFLNKPLIGFITLKLWLNLEKR